MNKLEEYYNIVVEWLEQYPLAFTFIKISLVLLVSYIAFVITRKIIYQVVHRLIKKTNTDIDDILLSDKLLYSISYIVPLIIIDALSNLFGTASGFIDVATDVLTVIVIMVSINYFIDSMTLILEKVPKFKDRPIKSYFQVVKIILFIWGVILLIGILTGQSPWALLGGLGAMTAVLLLIFRDTILSFVASIQISNYDLVKVGDWIEMKQFGADGDVIDISLNVIKVQNWDKTITTIPTYKLIDSSFKNWKGMTESGGRRISRSIFIDMNSIKFCDEEMIAKYNTIQVLKKYLEEKQKEVDNWNKQNNIDGTIPVNGRRITNIGTFRAYLENYLKNRKDINQNLTFLIRQLAPTEHGLPIQIYVFTNTTEWGKYEAIQSDIFDHILAVIPYFGLKVYQTPSGNDIKSINIGKE